MIYKPEAGDVIRYDFLWKEEQHLGLDDDRSWIKTHHVNVLTWPGDQMPNGVVPIKKGE
ncbi:MAG: hypothetical protein ACI8P9_001665 [Parasphingorhabdus sp.]|jgi:hypothetical protein